MPQPPATNSRHFWHHSFAVFYGSKQSLQPGLPCSWVHRLHPCSHTDTLLSNKGGKDKSLAKKLACIPWPNHGKLTMTQGSARQFGSLATLHRMVILPSVRMAPAFGRQPVSLVQRVQHGSDQEEACHTPVHWQCLHGHAAGRPHGLDVMAPLLGLWCHYSPMQAVQLFPPQMAASPG
jgi:hypothetical protein